MPPPTPPSTTRRRLPLPHSRRGWALLIGSSLLALLLVLWLLSRATPSWYHPLSPSDKNVAILSQRAETKIYYDLHNDVERTPLGDQRWSITQDQVNAYLAVNLPAAGLPGDTGPAPLVSAPFVRFSPGLVTVAARTSKVAAANPNGGVISAAFYVESSPSPAGPVGRIRLASASVGRLPIPTSVVQSKIRSIAPAIITVANAAITRQFAGDPNRSAARVPEIETAIHAIADEQPFPLTFSLHNRKVLVKEIRVDEGSLSITFSPPTPAAVPPRPPR